MQVEGKRRREGYHQEDVKHASGGKEKKGPNKRLVDNIRDDMKEYKGDSLKSTPPGQKFKIQLITLF